VLKFKRKFRGLKVKDRIGYFQLKEEAQIALCGGIVLEEALNLSSDRILNDDEGYISTPPLGLHGLF